MTLGPSDGGSRPETRGPQGGSAPVDDVSIVPGLGDPVPAQRADAPLGSPDLSRGRPLDLSQDPDRFDNAHDPVQQPLVVGPLDLSQDPDRMPRPGEGQSLTDLLGRGAMEDERNPYSWAFGLLGVLAFLAVVAYLFGEVLSA